jgi:hypothetical protein
MPPYGRFGLLLFLLYMVSWLIGYTLNEVTKQHKFR